MSTAADSEQRYPAMSGISVARQKEVAAASSVILRPHQSCVLRLDALRNAKTLASECGRLSGNASASACPVTGRSKAGRNFLLDSGASFNIIGRDELTHAELKTLRKCN